VRSGKTREKLVFFRKRKEPRLNKKNSARYNREEVIGLMGRKEAIGKRREKQQEGKKGG